MTFPTMTNYLHPNTLDMMILCFSYSLWHIYDLPLHINKLRDIFHLWYLFLPFIAYKYWLIILFLLQYFLSMLVILIPILTRSEQDQVCMFHNICFEGFQIYLLLTIMYHFEHANHDNHLDLLIQNLSELFSSDYNLHQ